MHLSDLKVSDPSKNRRGKVWIAPTSLKPTHPSIHEFGDIIWARSLMEDSYRIANDDTAIAPISSVMRHKRAIRPSKAL